MLKFSRFFRNRWFACVVYEDSAPSNWQEILAEQLIPAFVSPYHDKDIKPTGEPIKPHWHVVIMFDSVKTLEQVKKVFSLINGVVCSCLCNLVHYSRYLCHLDYPDLAQYNPEDVKCFCGADYFNVISFKE